MFSAPCEATTLRRMKQITRILIVSAALLACVVASVLAQKATAPKPAKGMEKDHSPVLVRVNGTAITEPDLAFFVKTRKLAKEDVPSNREMLIERLIDQQLLRDFLARKKITTDPTRMDLQIAQLKQRLKGGKVEPDEVLAKAGFTDATLRRELSLPLDWDMYVRQIVTEEKLREIWIQRKHEFDGSEVRAAQIALKSDDANADEKKLAAIRDDIVAKRIGFADAAKKHSQAPSAEKGGDLGQFGFRGKQPMPFPQVAFLLKVGEVSPPFRSAFGVHLLTVTEKVDGQLSLEDAKPEIFQQLSIEMQQETLKQERANAKIVRP